MPAPQPMRRAARDFPGPRAFQAAPAHPAPARVVEAPGAGRWPEVAPPWSTWVRCTNGRFAALPPPPTTPGTLKHHPAHDEPLSALQKTSAPPANDSPHPQTPPSPPRVSACTPKHLRAARDRLPAARHTSAPRANDSLHRHTPSPPLRTPLTRARAAPRSNESHLHPSDTPTLAAKPRRTAGVVRAQRETVPSCRQPPAASAKLFYVCKRRSTSVGGGV
jgi:hypothetical protein